MPLPNPYTPGQVPRVLAGREGETTLIRSRLGHVATFREYAGPVLTFHAPRGLGKTSLLREAQAEAGQAGFITAWAAVARGGPLLPELVRSVHRSLERTDSLTGARAKTWKQRVEKWTIELGVPGVKAGAQVATTPPPQVSAPIAELQDLLGDAANLVADAGGAGLLVCIDEVHAASGDELAVLLNAVQNMDGERSRYPLTVLVAGLPSTLEVLTRAATFGERTQFVALGRLDASGAAAAVVEPARELDVIWTDAALERLVADTDGYPYFLQLLAHATWEAARPGPGTKLTVSDLRAGYPEAVEQLRSVYRARWYAAAPAEQTFMTAMATVQVQSGADRTGSVLRSDIAAQLQRSSRAISTVRERLIDKGIIEVAGHGLLRFTLPGFGAYVRAEQLADDPDGGDERADFLRLLSRNVHPDAD